MKTINVISLKTLSTMMIAIVMILSSCNKEDSVFSLQDAQNIGNDGALEAAQDETQDIATSALNTNDPAGRVEGDDRSDCAKKTPGLNNTKEAGTITIDYGTAGCTDKKGNLRKGKIIVTWSGGRWFVAGSTHVVTTDGYSINDIAITGTRTVTNISTTNSPYTWTIAGSHTSTWPDGSTASRTVNRTRQLIKNSSDDKVIISQTAGASSAAAGTNRYGKKYSVQITTPLEYTNSCSSSNKVYKPVKGVKVVTVESKVYTVDFGTGTCDNTFTVTFNGKTKTFTCKNDSSND
jgi:hypothetical protein